MSPAAALCVLSGLPAAGKSRLARELRGRARARGWRTLLVTYDDLIPARDWRQSEWKQHRKMVLMCLERFLHQTLSDQTHTLSDQTHTLSDQTHTLSDQTQTHTLSDQTHTLSDQTHTLSDQTHTLSDQTQTRTLSDQTHTLSDQTHTLSDQTHTHSDQTHTLSDQTHTHLDQTHTLSDQTQTHTLSDQTHTLSDQTHTLSDQTQTHTLSDQTHTHSDQTHTLSDQTHTLSDQTHTLSDQTHTLSDQTHTLSDQTHTLSDQTRTLSDQTHTLSDQTHTLSDQTHTLSDQTHTLSDQTRTHSDQTHTLSDQTHTLSDQTRTHSDQTHTHSDQTHTLSDQTHTLSEADGVWMRFEQMRQQQSVSHTHTHSQPLVVLLDDNFFYQSMRHQIQQLARQYGVGFCQVFLRCPLHVCLQRNRCRSQPVPDDVLLQMCERMEPPNEIRNPWEQQSLTLDGTDGIADEHLQKLMDLLASALENPLSPVQDESPQKEADRRICASSVLHQADQTCRRLVSQAVASAREGQASPDTQKALAKALIELKTVFLQELKKSVLHHVSEEPVDVEKLLMDVSAAFQRRSHEIVCKRPDNQSNSD